MTQLQTTNERKQQWTPHAFTLIELLVVITIIAILAGLIVPAVNRALSSGKSAGCNSNVHQIGLALINFDNDFQHLPWNTDGVYSPQQDKGGMTTNSTMLSYTNWYSALYNNRYLPSAYDKGVWHCPGAPFSEVYAKDGNGNPANAGGYGVCNSVFRNSNNKNSKTFGNDPQRALKLSRISRPDSIWMVGDCGQPVPKSTPGEGRYFRTSWSFGRPSTKGNWDFTTAQPSTPSSPAMRHNGLANYATFDGHVTVLNWSMMQGESNDFTARADSGTF